MKMFDRTALSLAGALALAACATAPLATAPSAPAGEPAATAPPAPRNHDCWYFDPVEQRLLAVWISPRLTEAIPGGFRFVNLFFHDPTSPRPLLLHSRPVRLHDSTPLEYASRGRAFRVRPKQGKTWAEIETRDDLDVEFEDGGASG
ncbi:MAG: hypothetical protein KDE27_14780 [Planctomycetes bacterium]|nr:hypothetical protein [Planctomycetota bacterium]